MPLEDWLYSRSECFEYYHVTVDTFFFSLLTLLLSSFWTSRVVPSPSRFLPSILSRIGFSNPAARRFFIECC